MSSSEPALLRHYPALRRSLPWLDLGDWPTPVAPLERLSSALGAGVWIKRDDASGRIYGGNKVRKLEPLLGAALARGRRSVVTVGGIGSNHVAATAIYASRLGLETHAVLTPQPVTAQVRENLGLLSRLGVHLLPCPARALVPLYLAIAKRRARESLLIGPGGSSPLGTLGYVSAALELREQVESSALPLPDDIWVALGSGGTVAGLALGLTLAGLPCRVIGVRVVERALINAAQVRLLMMRTRRLLRRSGMGKLPRARAPLIEHRHFGGRYGRPSPEGRAALELASSTEGLKLDPTYTAKVLAALIEHSQGPGRGRRALFWNTFSSRPLGGLVAAGGGDRALPRSVQRWLEREETY